MKPNYKITLFLDRRDLGVIQPDGSYGTKNHSDWHVNIPFYKTFELVEDYVHIYVDPFQSSMPRQLVNPYYLDYGFFENIKSYSSNTENVEGYNISTKAPLYGIDINK